MIHYKKEKWLLTATFPFLLYKSVFPAMIDPDILNFPIKFQRKTFPNESVIGNSFYDFRKNPFQDVWI